MDGKMYCKQVYKCGICGKEHMNIVSRAQCEMACIKKQEEEAKKAAELKKQQEHDSRKADTDAKVKAAIDAVNAYTKDYGFYTYDGEVTNIIHDFPYKLLHHFL